MLKTSLALKVLAPLAALVLVGGGVALAAEGDASPGSQEGQSTVSDDQTEQVGPAGEQGDADEDCDDQGQDADDAGDESADDADDDARDEADNDGDADACHDEGQDGDDSEHAEQHGGDSHEAGDEEAAHTNTHNGDD